MSKITLNRDTEKIIFHPPAGISFIKTEKQGKVCFWKQAIVQMNLKPGGYVEFDIEDDDWYVFKSDNPNGFKLFRAGGKKESTLAISSNKLVRGFLSHLKLRDTRCLRCHVEPEGEGKYHYTRYKITLILKT